MFFNVFLSAAFDISIISTLNKSISRAKVIPIHPVPAPISMAVEKFFFLSCQ